MKNALFISLFTAAYVCASAEDWDLIAAAYKGDLQLLNHSLQMGADINFTDSGGDTACITAATNGHHKLMQRLIEVGSNVNAVDSLGTTALMWACIKGHYRVTKVLLDSGAEINAQESSGATALIWAAYWHRSEIIKLLLDRGADLSLKNFEEKTALQKALQYRDHKDNTVPLLRTVQAFLVDPLREINAHPQDTIHYVLWSISYKKNEAYDFLIKEAQGKLETSSLVAKCFLIAARVGNVTIFNALKNVLKAQNREGFQVIFLKALFFIMRLHPALLSMTYQLCAEEIAPARLYKK